MAGIKLSLLSRFIIGFAENCLKLGFSSLLFSFSLNVTVIKYRAVKSKQVVGVEDEDTVRQSQLSRESVEVLSVSLLLRKDLCIRGLTGILVGIVETFSLSFRLLWSFDVLCGPWSVQW